MTEEQLRNEIKLAADNYERAFKMAQEAIIQNGQLHRRLARWRILARAWKLRALVTASAEIRPMAPGELEKVRRMREALRRIAAWPDISQQAEIARVALGEPCARCGGAGKVLFHGDCKAGDTSIVPCPVCAALLGGGK